MDRIIMVYIFDENRAKPTSLDEANATFFCDLPPYKDQAFYFFVDIVASDV